VRALTGSALTDLAPLELDGSRSCSERLVELHLRSPDLLAPAGVRVLLPDADPPGGGDRHPVLYLLHGGRDDFRSWTDKGGAERLTEGTPLVVVMASGGHGGWYADWHHGGAGGPPAWERFHIHQLVPWVDANLRTAAERRGRAVAGLSMGGCGAMGYAARHPDLFCAAASFSGALDLRRRSAQGAVAALAAEDGFDVHAPFGDPVTDEARWRAHNPTDLAEGLRGLHLAVRSGDGTAGVHDAPGAVDPLERSVGRMNTTFHRRLDELGIAHRFELGPGTHDWPYWQDALAWALPGLLAALGADPDRA
jgi:diacylglycerol O-acyltransferase / trehalose O-mycolyltransferase